jgi:hypothetical protein
MDIVSTYVLMALLQTKAFAPNVIVLALLVQKALHINVLHVPKNGL